MQSAMNAVIDAAVAYSDCAAEFGDPGYCGEALQEVWTAVDRLRKAQEA
jgi:hypothetical protein